MNSSRTLIALATFNELENLPGLIEATLRVLPDADILVIDDNSPDGTGRWCDERAAIEPRLKCLHRAAKLGLGTATLDAMRYALDQNYDTIVTMDADWSHDPAHLPALVAAAANADVAIGSRYVAGSAIGGWPLYRRFASRVLNRLSRTLLRLPVQDSSGAFRAYCIAKLRDIRLDEIRAHGFAYLEEILWHLARENATFVEVPITFRKRHGGRSKANLREVAGKARTLLWLAAKRRAH